MKSGHTADIVSLLCIGSMQKLLVKFNFNPAGYIAGTAIFVVGAIIAEVTNLDYGMYGITLIYIFYVFRQQKLVKSGVDGTFVWAMPFYQFVGIIALVPVSYTHLDVYKRQHGSSIWSRPGLGMTRPRLLAIWEKYVSEKPRPGYYLSLIHI